MRFGSLATITAGLLGFAGQVLGVVYGNEVTRHVAITKSKFIEDWDKNGRKCLERARRGGPLLFPPEFDLDKQHQDLFKNIIEHILEIHDEIERDGFRHLAATKDSTVRRHESAP